MSCLNHVAEVNIQTDWWSKMSQTIKQDGEIMQTLQARSAKKTRGLVFYK